MKTKKTTLAQGLIQDQKPEPPSSEMLAQMAAEVWARNCDTLVAHWILKNPDVPAGEITLTNWADSEGMHFKVTRAEKTAPEVLQ